MEHPLIGISYLDGDLEPEESQDFLYYLSSRIRAVLTHFQTMSEQSTIDFGHVRLYEHNLRTDLVRITDSNRLVPG